MKWWNDWWQNQKSWFNGNRTRAYVSVVSSRAYCALDANELKNNHSNLFCVFGQVQSVTILQTFDSIVRRWYSAQIRYQCGCISPHCVYVSALYTTVCMYLHEGTINKRAKPCQSSHQQHTTKKRNMLSIFYFSLIVSCNRTRVQRTTFNAQVPIIIIINKVS